MDAMHIEDDACPVCGMDAGGSTICAEHLSIEYHFCTAQCRENFLARPKLYTAGQSAGGSGRKVVKRRSFTLDSPVDLVHREHLIGVLELLMGIQHVNIDQRKISIDYNLIEITASQIEQALENAGATLGSGWSERLKRGWVHYTEENELDHLAAGEAACCNKPPAKG